MIRAGALARLSATPLTRTPGFMTIIDRLTERIPDLAIHPQSLVTLLNVFDDPAVGLGLAAPRLLEVNGP